VPADPAFGRRIRGRLTAMRWPRAFEERRVGLPRAGTPEPRRSFVVCGDDALAVRLVEELARRYRAEVTALLTSREHNQGPKISKIPGVRIVEAPRLDLEAFRAARVASADALALVRQDDVGNIHAALTAQDLNPHLRVVVRMFNMSLGHGIRRLFHDCAVLSDASMAAPAFVAAALGQVEPSHVRLPGRTLFVARRGEVDAKQVLCGLAVTENRLPGESPMPDEVLPADQGRADLVLATTDGAGPPRLSVPERSSRYRWRWSGLRNAIRALINRKLWLAAAALVAVLVLGTIALVVQHLTPGNAAYLALLTAVGGADADTAAGAARKITDTIITLAGVALVPVVTAAVVEAVVNARLAIALGQLRQPYADHVVVVGLGNVGTRVIRQLHDIGVPVVAIDKVETARGAEIARQLGIPLIVGDASREETLRDASVQTCRALVVLSTDDIVNLEAALNGRALQQDLRVVLRLFDGDFAARVEHAFGIQISRSVSYVAAPAFAAAMMERDVLATIPVGRRVLLIAEIQVGAGSIMDGATVGDANLPGQAWAIAMQDQRRPRLTWQPPASQPVAAGDWLVIVATRAGLGQTVARVSTPTAPDTASETPPETAGRTSPGTVGQARPAPDADRGSAEGPAAGAGPAHRLGEGPTRGPAG
jgi:Trk K+ transport system NAD-binding subunit